MTVTLSLALMILALSAIAMAAGLGQTHPVPAVARKAPMPPRIRRAAGPAVLPCLR